MPTASSAIVTWRLFASASEYTATVRMPIRRAVVITRQAISPRLAISILLNTMIRRGEQRAQHARDKADQFG